MAKHENVVAAAESLVAAMMDDCSRGAERAQRRAATRAGETEAIEKALRTIAEELPGNAAASLRGRIRLHELLDGSETPFAFAPSKGNIVFALVFSFFVVLFTCRRSQFGSLF